MKNKIINTILPTIIGILSVLGLLIIVNLILYKGDFLISSDNEFFKYFVPGVTIIAMIIQFSLTLPLWEKFKSRKKVLGMTLIQFTGLICIIAGLAFGLVFWETSFGINELIMVSITGIIAFAVYWISNLLTLKKLDKIL